MIDFSNDVVMVTGAAGNLGQAVVRQFLGSGAVVCGLDHKQGRLSHLGGGADGRFFAFDGVDVTDRDSMAALLPKVHASAGQATILVNALGGFLAGETVHGLTWENWEKMLTLNVTSFLNLTGTFMPDLLAQGRGKVISVSARAALHGGVNMGAYGAAKAALLRLTESMAAELAPHHIQVNCVLPGTIDTPQNRAEMPTADFSNWVVPDVIAEVILFLCSPAADRISGAALPVYG